jgi:hypothetical protein
VRSRNLENDEAKARYRAVENTATVGYNAKKTNNNNNNNNSGVNNTCSDI